MHNKRDGVLPSTTCTSLGVIVTFSGGSMHRRENENEFEIQIYHIKKAGKSGAEEEKFYLSLTFNAK